MHHKKWVMSAVCALSLACCTIGTIQPAHAWTTQTLRYSSSGSEVREVQGRLKMLGFYHGALDGDYGWRTYWAVKDFQYQFGLPTNGLVDEKTKAMMARATPNYHGPWTGQSMTTHAPSGSSGSSGNSSSGNSSSGNSSSGQSSPGHSTSSSSAKSYEGAVGGLSSHDIHLMAMLVYGEARGEPFIGQVGVADVVLHRLKSSKFPNTVAGVIYQPGAFTAASNGQMNQVPNAEAYKAVHEAVAGYDPVGPAISYFNPSKTNNAYMWSRPQVIKLGHQIFTM